MFGITRLLFVSLLAVLAFIAAVSAFSHVPVKECQMAASYDPTYQATLVEAPTVNATLYHLAVTHDGAPVHGATVCLRADMGGPGGMSGMATSNLARETGPGRYQIDVTFQMGGYWRGRIVIQESGKSAVVAPLVVTVH